MPIIESTNWFAFVNKIMNKQAFKNKNAVNSRTCFLNCTVGTTTPAAAAAAAAASHGRGEPALLQWRRKRRKEWHIIEREEKERDLNKQIRAAEK